MLKQNQPQQKKIVIWLLMCDLPLDMEMPQGMGDNAHWGASKWGNSRSLLLYHLVSLVPHQCWISPARSKVTVYLFVLLHLVCSDCNTLLLVMTRHHPGRSNKRQRGHILQGLDMQRSSREKQMNEYRNEEDRSATKTLQIRYI